MSSDVIWWVQENCQSKKDIVLDSDDISGTY